MPVIEELICIEQDGTISFGNYKLGQKAKKSDFEYQGDMYKVKTYNEITKLERNDMFVYESVPGTAASISRLRMRTWNSRWKAAGMHRLPYSLRTIQITRFTLTVQP